MAVVETAEVEMIQRPEGVQKRISNNNGLGLRVVLVKIHAVPTVARLMIGDATAENQQAADGHCELDRVPRIFIHWVSVPHAPIWGLNAR